MMALTLNNQRRNFLLRRSVKIFQNMKQPLIQDGSSSIDNRSDNLSSDKAIKDFIDLPELISKNYELEKYDECIELIKRHREIQKNTSLFGMMQARCLLKLSKFNEAKQILNSILKDEPMNYEAGFIFSSCLYQEGELSVCIITCCAILSADPSLVHVEALRYKASKLNDYLKRGLLYYTQGRFRKALRNYNNAMEIDKSNKKLSTVLHNNRGMTLQHLRYHKSAVEDFNKVLEMDSSNEKIFWKRARSLYKIKKFEECRQDCEAALLFDEKDEKVKYLLKKTKKKLHLVDQGSKSRFTKCPMIKESANDLSDVLSSIFTQCGSRISSTRQNSNSTDGTAEERQVVTGIDNPEYLREEIKLNNFLSASNQHQLTSENLESLERQFESSF